MITSNDTRPLAGLRVVDFSQHLAGPMTAMFLADSGVDVIRNDRPSGPGGNIRSTRRSRAVNDVSSWTS